MSRQAKSKGTEMPSVVVIGASLGGVAALKAVLGALPADFGAPVAIVLHRPAAGDEALAAALRDGSPLPIVEPDDKEPLAPGRVYVAPADYHLLVEAEALALSTEAPVNFARPAIDVLLESAADSHGAHVVAVLLTGANADGAEGARRIAERGGVVLVQDPASAQASALPAAVIAAIGSERARVLPLARIGSELAALCPARGGQER